MKWLVALALLASVSAADAFDIKDNHPSAPDPMREIMGRPTTLVAIGPWYSVGVVGCSALTLMMDVGIHRRELKRSEAAAVVAGCFLPIIGSMLVKRYFAKHPELDVYTAEERAAVTRDRFGVHGYE